MQKALNDVVTLSSTAINATPPVFKQQNSTGPVLGERMPSLFPSSQGGAHQSAFGALGAVLGMRGPSESNMKQAANSLLNSLSQRGASAFTKQTAESFRTVPSFSENKGFKPPRQGEEVRANQSPSNFNLND